MGICVCVCGWLYLFRVEIRELGTGHVLCQTDGSVADANGVSDHFLELVFGVSGAELPGVGVHRECHS